MDISSLRERPGSMPMSVGELNGFIKNMFDSNRLLSALSVSGEISNFVSHKSGHLYFSLKDSEGQVRAVMFRSSAERLRFRPENGMRVVVRCSVSVFVRDGSYQLYVTSMQPDGIGALYLAYEQLKARLAAEGLFDAERKKPIPEYPERIGVITSPTGAAVRDIVNVLTRRYPIAKIYLYPALVQGDGAEENLIRGIDYFDRSGLVDTVIIGRGGGSIEDLWAFNGERLARRIFSANVPVISAVGHETDFTICDFVSDLRAPTPSAAAELASPDIRELAMRLGATEDRIDRALMLVVERMRTRLSKITERGVLSSPSELFSPYREQLRELIQDATDAVKSVSVASANRFTHLCGRLEGLNPLSVLARGFSVVSVDGHAVKSSTELEVGDTVSLRLSSGSAEARIINKT